jgi:hypothetical protein
VSRGVGWGFGAGGIFGRFSYKLFIKNDVTVILRVTSVLATSQTNSEEDRKGAKITARLEWAEWEAARLFL